MLFFTTIAIASIVVMGAMALIGIGWLLTGKSGIRPGSCGRAPGKNRDASCGTDQSCGLCGKGDADDVRQKKS